MLNNYLKIALRNLLKNKSFSFINIFGLAAGMSLCLLCILLIKDANSYDLFHSESDQIHRITTTPIRKNGRTEQYASSPFIAGKTLKEDYSQVELWTPLVMGFHSGVLKNGNLISSRGLFTDASFFEMFGFQLAEGDASQALAEPYSVVITSEFAKRIFENDDPIGKELEMPRYDTKFKVTGVLKDFPGKTHLEFDALGSLATKMGEERLSGSSQVTSNWLDYYTSYNFVKLKKGVDKASVEAALKDMTNTHFEGLALETRDMGYQFNLQPLNEITPGPIMSQNMGRSLPVQVLWFFSLLSIVVMGSACFNYTNLSIARSLTRAREVGVRKVMGATRPQVFGQFISEALVMSVFALGVGYLMLEGMIPAFNSIGLFSEADIALKIDASVVAMFVAFTLVVALLAGALPALVLSKFSPLSIMQKLENVKLFRRVGLRKALIVFQFAISLVFILVLSIAWKQIGFAVSQNFGAERTDIVNVSMNGQSYDKMEAAFSQLPQIEKISACSHLMGTWQDGSSDVRRTLEEEKMEVRHYSIDHNFIKNFDLELLAGGGFPENRNQQKEVFAIVNEKFLETFGLGTADEAIGQPLILGDSTHVAIKGVVKDFLYKPLTYNLEPMLLRYQPENLWVMNLSVNTTDMPTTMAAMERTWKQLETGQDFSYEFYDETTAGLYADMKELASVVGYFGALGLIIACLGLLGMAIYSVETKAKEISIRKIIGASAGDLVKQLSKGYLLLLLIAVLVAVPVSFLLGNMMLQTFAFSIPLNVWVFLPGVVGLVVLGIITIGSQTVRAALANPVTNLRSE